MHRSDRSAKSEVRSGEPATREGRQILDIGQGQRIEWDHRGYRRFTSLLRPRTEPSWALGSRIERDIMSRDILVVVESLGTSQANKSVVHSAQP